MKKIELLFTVLCIGALNGMENSQPIQHILRLDGADYLIHSTTKANMPAKASDLQIYTFLSTLKNIHHYYLPLDLVQIIATKAHNIESRYEKYGTCLNSHKDLWNFIQNCCKKSIDNESIANILKSRFAHSEKSLCKIKKTPLDQTIFHLTCMFSKPHLALNIIKIIRLIATDDEAWQLLQMEDGRGTIALYSCNKSKLAPCVEELLAIAPNPDEIWQLILKLNDYSGDSVLHHITSTQYIDILKVLLSVAPNAQEVWKQVKEHKTKKGATPWLCASHELRTYLKSYCPTNPKDL